MCSSDLPNPDASRELWPNDEVSPELLPMSRIQAAQALGRFKVVDLSRVRSGPNCVRVLSDFGADVIRVEPPPGVDENEALFAADRIGGDFQNINRNKRSITLNMAAKPGQEILTELIKQCDVLVENFKAGTLEKWGFTNAWLEENAQIGRAHV